MSLSIFPDINLWLALSVPAHVHHAPAWAWYQGLGPGDRLYFARFTQMGLLRLLSLEAVMGKDEAMSQPAAWQTYDRWLEDPNVGLLREPEHLEARFRRHARAPRPVPKAWGDDYLCAFAQSAGLQLATLDRTLSRRADEAILIA